MTSLDIMIALETFSQIEHCFIDTIYSIDDKIFLLKLRGVITPLWKNPYLLIEPGKRIHLTKFKRIMPERPSNKLVSLRKHVKNRRITSIKQHGYDRVIIIELSGESDCSLYVELFGKGNMILVENNRIIFSLWYRKMRDRNLLPGKSFEFPPVRGVSIITADVEAITNVIEKVSREKPSEQLVKCLVRNFGSSGQLVEEILSIAGIDKTTSVSTFNIDQVREIIKAVNAIKDRMSKGPAGIIESDSTPISVVPFPFESITGKLIAKQDFHEALDDYFSPYELVKSKEMAVQENKIKQLEKILAKQRSHLDKHVKRAELLKIKGNKFFAQIHLVQELFDTILNARKKNVSWDTIKSKLAKGKENGIPAAQIYEDIDEANKKITLTIDGMEFVVDFTLRPVDIANSFYTASKKAEGKIRPANEAIDETLEKIEKARTLKGEAEKKARKFYKKRERRWYEHFHWSKTINGYLIIGGRDMKSNDSLVRRRMKDNSLFFHADVHGAPYVILMPDEEKIPAEQPGEDDLKEAALIAGVYSKAWKARHGSVDVYYVSPDQVSHTAPSGEYVPKGGIMIRGRKNYIKNIPLSLTIGIVFSNDHAMVIGGSYENVKLQTDCYSTIKPSDEKKGAIAKRLKQVFMKKVHDEDKRYLIERMDLNEIVAFIP